MPKIPKSSSLQRDICAKIYRADYERLIQLAKKRQCPRGAILRDALLCYLDSCERSVNLKAVS